MGLSENNIISITTIGIIITVLGLVVGLSINRKCYNVYDKPDTSIGPYHPPGSTSLQPSTTSSPSTTSPV